jgi:hypothetical protein
VRSLHLEATRRVYFVSTLELTPPDAVDCRNDIDWDGFAQSYVVNLFWLGVNVTGSLKVKDRAAADLNGFLNLPSEVLTFSNSADVPTCHLVLGEWSYQAINFNVTCDPPPRSLHLHACRR